MRPWSSTTASTPATVSRSTRATRRRSIGRPSAASAPAPSTAPRGRPFESSPRISFGPRRREGRGRAPEAARFRGGRSGIYGPPRRDRPRLPAGGRPRGSGGPDADEGGGGEAGRKGGPARAGGGGRGPPRATACVAAGWGPTGGPPVG